MPDLLIDTNVLVLLVVGSHDRRAVGRFKRTATFSNADYDRLTRLIGQYRRLLTTPAVMTEVGNLLGNAHRALARTVVSVLGPAGERTVPKADILANAFFPELGYADTSLLLSADRNTTVLTDDWPLYNVLLYHERAAMNFNHLRTPRRG